MIIDRTKLSDRYASCGFLKNGYTPYNRNSPDRTRSIRWGYSSWTSCSVRTRLDIRRPPYRLSGHMYPPFFHRPPESTTSSGRTCTSASFWNSRTPDIRSVRRSCRNSHRSSSNTRCHRRGCKWGTRRRFSRFFVRTYTQRTMFTVLIKQQL